MNTKGRRIYLFLALFGAVILFLFLNNTSLFAGKTNTEPFLIAHRGLAQEFDREGLTGETCTANRMISTGHRYLENTIASMAAAFSAGANMVEIDVHQTTDNRFAIFHDWTVDCRTEGTGVTRNHALAELQGLDIGYGYTSDEGQTWPFRGTGVGLMPSLEEVFNTFPEYDFVIDVKSNDAVEGELLADRLEDLAADRTGSIMLYGGARPVNVVRDRLPHIRTITRPRLKKCLLRYILFGWTGYVPESCSSSMVMVPANVAPWLWGWPHRFVTRMNNENSRVVLIGDYSGERFTQGFDDPNRIDEIPKGYAGGIWTDRIDLIGPAIRNRQITD